MSKELLTYIQIHQEPISESRKRCGIDTTTHKDDSLDDLLELAKKNINVFPFSNVKPCWFQLYANVCIAKAIDSLDQLDFDAGIDGKCDDIENEIFGKAVSSLDNALIIADGGNEDTKELVHKVLQRLDRILYPHDPYSDHFEDVDNFSHNDDDDDSDEENQTPPAKKRRLNTATSTTDPPPQSLPSNLAFVPKLHHPMPHLTAPSLSLFESHIHTSNTPIILKNTLTHWPALTKWPDPTYWLRRTLDGHRLVPIELGQSYTDEEWRQEIMPFKRFLDEFILRGDEAMEIGYLAQHDLFSQIPGLRGDFGVPDYCFADVPVEVDEWVDEVDEADQKGGGEGGVGPRERGGRLLHDGSLTTTSTKQVPVQTSIAAERESTSNQDTRLKSTPTHSQNAQNPYHKQDRLGPSGYTNPDTSPPPSSSRSQSPSPAPPQIHQNIWFGTRTVTPLHHDPYSNILTQIHGTKYIRLYSPKYTAQLYPRSAKEVAPHVNVNGQSDSTHPQNDGDSDSDRPSNDDQGTQPPTIDMSNTSNVPLWSIEQSPCEDWDEEYPGFSSVPYVEGLLQPGDAVYIPKGWWHYVRGLVRWGLGLVFGGEEGGSLAGEWGGVGRGLTGKSESFSVDWWEEWCARIRTGECVMRWYVREGRTAQNKADWKARSTIGKM